MTPGQIAYEGYCKASGGKSLISGQPLPGWDGLTSSIQTAWEWAANAVLRAGWHPASEEPVNIGDVLVTDGMRVDMGYLDGDGVEWITRNSYLEVTHWRELPPLPEGGEK